MSQTVNTQTEETATEECNLDESGKDLDTVVTPIFESLDEDGGKSNTSGNNNRLGKGGKAKSSKTPKKTPTKTKRNKIVDSDSDRSNDTESDSSSSSSSSSASSDELTDEDRRARAKRKRKKKLSKKHKLKKRKYKRSQSTSKSRSKLNRRKRKTEDVEELPEFKRALEKRLREMGYQSGNEGTSGRTVPRSRSGTPKGKLPKAYDTVIKSPSEPTIYAPAVERYDDKRIIPSAKVTEEEISRQINKIRIDLTDKFAEQRGGAAFAGDEVQPGTSGERPENLVAEQRGGAAFAGDEVQPGTSGERPENLVAAAKEAANMAIIQAEKFKAKVNNPAGNVVDQLNLPIRDDDEFIHITSHVDQSIKEKIQRGEFIELEKLLVKNRTSGHDRDNKDMLVDVVTKDGHTYLAPKTEKGNAVTGVRKWEQAFRVYASIYSSANPSRANEIWQYVDIINRAAGKYTWENVSSYDYQFRRWMSENPMRNWGKTLTQIWNLELVDHVQKNSSQVNGTFNRNKKGQNVNLDGACWRFNKGKCEFGRQCRFGHWCAFCGGTNHGSYNCRRKNGERSSSASSGQTNNQKGREEKKKDKNHTEGSTGTNQN